MISVLILAFTLIQLIYSQQLAEVCNQEVSSSFCKVSIVKYYYDKTTGQCSTFIYGGCGGNQNRFDTLEECQAKCVKVEVTQKPICEQNAETGPCRAIIPRYFYNKQTKNCELFIFGGCNGNSNNFSTYQDCMKTCF